MTKILATTGNNVLRAGATGIQVARYWTYAKHPYGESWEGDFPDTIYLVGCGPPWSVNLFCADAPDEKVYYRRSICLTSAPTSDYIFSWDRRSLCPWDAHTEICGSSYIDGADSGSAMDICIQYGDPAVSLLGPLFNLPLEYGTSFKGFVEADNYLDGADCLPKTYTDRLTFGPYTDGKMGKVSPIEYTHGPITLTLNTEEGTAHAAFAESFSPALWPRFYTVSYAGEADFVFNPVTGGTANIEVIALGASYLYGYGVAYGWGRTCPADNPTCWGEYWGGCPTGNECGGPVTCNAGSLQIDFTITERGIC